MASYKRLPTSYNTSTYGNGTRDYTVLDTWEAATDIDLVTATKGEVLDVYADAAEYDDCFANFAGATVNASYFRVVQAASGEKWSGGPDTGARFNSTAAACWLTFGEDYVGIYDLELTLTINDAASFYVLYLYGENEVVIGGCYFDQPENSGAGVARCIHYSAEVGDKNYIVNCVHKSKSSGDVFILSHSVAGGEGYFFNCTSYLSTGAIAFYATSLGDADCHNAFNCIAYNGDTYAYGWYAQPTAVWNKTTCLGEHDPAGTPSVVFKDASGGDLSLVGTSIDAINQGTNLSSHATFAFDDDCEGNTRGTQKEYGSNWDIGAFEYQGAIVISGDEAKLLVEFLLDSETKRLGTSHHVDTSGNPFREGIVESLNISKEIDELGYGIQGRSTVKVSLANKNNGLYGWELDDETGASWGTTYHGLSLANGQAFFRAQGVDLSGYASGSAYLLLEVHDSAGKKARGFISVADVAEALGSDLLTNGTFEVGGTGGDFNGGAEIDDGTSDVFTGRDNVSVDDGAGNKIEATATVHGGSVAGKYTKTTGAAPYSLESYTVEPGKLYKFSFWTRGDGSQCGRIAVWDKTAMAVIITAAAGSTGITGTDYTQVSHYVTAPSGCVELRITFLAPKAAGSAYYDDASLKEVTDVGTDGVHIVSEMGGTARNWTYIDAAFDYNDATYTFELLACGECWSHIVKNEEIRGRWSRIYRYLPEDGTLFEYRGKIVDYELTPGQIDIFLEMRDDEILDTLLPQDVVTTDEFSATALDVGKPVNICIGHCRGVPLRNIQNDLVNDYYDYLICYGTIESLWTSSGGRGIMRDGETADPTDYTFYDGAQGSPHAGYAFVRFTLEQMSHSGPFHVLTADVKGLEMGGATAQRNFATVLKTLLNDSTYGLNDNVDSTSFTSAAATLTALGNMYCDGKIHEQRKARDWIDLILDPARSTLKRGEDGEWEIAVDQTGSSVMTFGAEDGLLNNCDIMSYSRTPSKEALKTAYIRYDFGGVDESLPYKEVSLAVNTSFGVDQVFDLTFVQNDDTAEIVAAYKKNFALYSELFVSITTNRRGRNLREGEIITLSAPEFVISAETFVVQGMDKSLDTFTYHLRSYSSAIFGAEVITPPTAWTGKTSTIKGPKVLEGAVTLGDGDTRPGTLKLQVAATKGDTYIAAGKTGFTNTDNGFIIGIDDSDSDKVKMYVGNADYFFNWTGSVFTLQPSAVEIKEGADIRIEGKDADPGRIRWLGTSYNVGMYANTVGSSFVIAPESDDVTVLALGYSTKAFSTITLFAANTITLYTEDNGYGLVVDDALGTVKPASATKTEDMGTSSLAFDDMYADDFQNVADFPHLDAFDDLSAIKAIKGSGKFDSRTGLEMIDDDTLPPWLVSKFKRDYFDKDGTQILRKGEVMLDPDGKPYISLKAAIALCWGALRQVDGRLNALEK